MHLVLKWPTLQDSKKFMAGFGVKGLQKVIGAIDGTHISIKAPAQNPENYVNRKGYHSIVLQAICDHRMKFTDCYIGWPGSVHDSHIFTNSDIFYKIEEIQLSFAQIAATFLEILLIHCLKHY